MSRIHWSTQCGFAVGLGCVLAALLPTPQRLPASSQPQPGNDLASAIRYVPPDAALVLYVDVARLWESPILTAVRSADRKPIADLTALGQSDFGLTPDDVQSVIVAVPKITGPVDASSLVTIVHFKKAFDQQKLAKAAEKYLPTEFEVKVFALNERTALVLLNLDDTFAKPQPADRTGPLTPVLKQAASGKHLAVAGATLANLPEELRGDDLPAELRPFQPFFRAQTITATLDLNKSLDLDVRVNAATAGNATDCEKALGLLLQWLQEGLSERIEQFEKEAGAKDIVTFLKAIRTATQGVKVATLGRDVRLTATLPLDLPFGPAYTAAKKKVEEAAAAAQSANNLKQIGLAMHNYHDLHGACPPAAVCDKTAKPLLSWRVLILPFIEQNDLYMQFKLDEPWDSEHNKKLLAKMPKVYALPGKTKPGDTTTYYRVFVGKGAGFEWVMATKLLDITDGTSNTIMVATAAEAVPWTKPDELEFDPEKDMTKLLGAIVNGKVQVAYFDGSVRTFAKFPNKKTLNALITRSGGEVIDDDGR
jgi:hypothetical protein